MSKIYGYARISSRDQHEDRQLTALNSFGVDIIFVDKQSGKNFDRPQYKKLLRKLKPNDVLVVKSIDRLGRNYAEILEQWRVIATTLKQPFLLHSFKFSFAYCCVEIFEVATEKNFTAT